MRDASETYDLCIIGCGAGGFGAAMRALDLGKKVCIIEQDEIGGAGVRWGALASKTMWELSKDYAVAAKTDRGYRTSNLYPVYSDVRDTVMQAVREKQYQMLSQIETFSPRRWQGPGSLTLKRGLGSFVNKDTIKITSCDKEEEIIKTKNVLIASGSTPRSFPGIDFDHKKILSSDSIFNLKAFPKRLMIIGAGIVGCEYATIFSNFQQTKVYLVDHEERVIPYEDSDVSEFVCSCLVDNGVKIFHSAVLKEVQQRGEYLDVILDYKDGHSQVVEVDAVLISIGRLPDMACIQLDRAGIIPEKNGRLPTNENCKITGNIYAAGDVTHMPALVNIAEREGRHAVSSMFNIPEKPLSYKDMSTIMFFHPAVAAVGLNENACRKRGIPYRAAYFANAFLTRAIAMRALRGFVKIIATDEDNPKILGLRAAGPQVSSTVMSIAIFMEQERGIRELLQTLFPHPTMSEGIQECVRLLLGESIYKPHAFPDSLKTWRWKPE